MLDELAASLKEKGFTFTYDNAVAAYLANKSYSLTYGARNPVSYTHLSLPSSASTLTRVVETTSRRSPRRAKRFVRSLSYS